MGNYKYENKLAYGIGILDKGYYPACVLRKNTKEYQLWLNMLGRCYSQRIHLKNPTYLDCSVSDNFKSFQYFADWANKQIGFGLKGYALDKDILSKGNKVYSEDNCVFVPSNLNNFLITSKAIRGSCPIGVSFYKRDKKYSSSLKVNLNT